MPPHTGKKTVLVTGAAGFIGSWVADTLLARGDDVVIVDEVRERRNAVARELTGKQRRQCSIRDNRSLFLLLNTYLCRL